MRTPIYCIIVCIVAGLSHHSTLISLTILSYLTGMIKVTCLKIKLECAIHSISILSNALSTPILFTNTLHCCPLILYIYPKPKSDPGITKNPDIYFQPIYRAKPMWWISIEFGSNCNERNKMMTLEFRRLDTLQTRSWQRSYISN